ncbi:MAG: OmpH family outer membrane protein [Gemmataceae bacterium]|nr:OmpH family outer membrane protein [Gemmataceae bacterium]
MKRNYTRFAAIAAIGSVLAFGSAVEAQAPTGGTTPPPAAAAPRAQRIVIVNIAKVLRDYQKANDQGAEITRKRQAYVSQVQVLRDKVVAVNAEFQKAPNPDVKKRLQEDALVIQRQIEDIDRRAQVELTQLSNDTIVRVYKEIKGVIFDIAKTNNLDMVLCYPAASKEEDDNSPQVAQLMLQTPALIPFYHSQMDITHVVVATLNQRYPGVQKASGETTPMLPPKK